VELRESHLLSPSSCEKQAIYETDLFVSVSVSTFHLRLLSVEESPELVEEDEVEDEEDERGGLILDEGQRRVRRIWTLRWT